MTAQIIPFDRRCEAGKHPACSVCPIERICNIPIGQMTPEDRAEQSQILQTQTIPDDCPCPF